MKSYVMYLMRIFFVILICLYQFLTVACHHRSKHNQPFPSPPTPPPAPDAPGTNYAVGSYNGDEALILAVSKDGGVTWTYSIEAGTNLPITYSYQGVFKNVNCSGLNCTAGGSYFDGSVYAPMLAVSNDGGASWTYKIESGINLPAAYSDQGVFNSVNCSGLNCTAGGSYFDGSAQVPMLAVSNDGGTTWTYKIESGSPNLPFDFSDQGVFKSVTCSGLNCTAGGSYFDSSSTQVPMLAVSNDGGATWTYKIESGSPNLPLGFSDQGVFNSVNCSGLNCTAGGNYFDGSVYAPMLAVSNNGGATWTYKIESGTNLPTDYFDEGVFNSVNCSGVNCTASGSYSDSFTQFPMLAVSNNGGANWTYKIQSGTNLPTDFDKVGYLVSVNCSGLNCMAGGAYQASQIPMLTVSNDGGANWTYKIQYGTNLPTDFLNGGFASISCSGLGCIAGGYYNNINSILTPMLAVSSDGGATWIYKIESGTNLPTDFNNGNFNSVNCSDLNCIAGGTYFNTHSKNVPMLAVSGDGGASWTYKIESGTNLPTNFSDNGYFSSVNCSGLNCTAGGGYVATPGSKMMPMLAVSNDGGATWTYKIELGLNLPMDFNNGGSFNSVNCSDLNCTAGGGYINTNGKIIPMLAVSNDGGANWTYKIESGTNLPTAFSGQGLFYSVNCSGSNCTAGGSYSDGSTQFPMLAVSNDGGTNWTYKIESGTNLPAAYANPGIFYSVNCSGSNCTAGGFYFDAPMLAVSNDGGTNWTYKIESGTNLPTAYSNQGSFKSVNCSGLNCTAAGSYFTNSNSIAVPMLAVSNDGGMNWIYKIDAVTNLPIKFRNSGTFSGIDNVAASTFSTQHLTHKMLIRSRMFRKIMTPRDPLIHRND